MNQGNIFTSFSLTQQSLGKNEPLLDDYFIFPIAPLITL